MLPPASALPINLATICAQKLTDAKLRSGLERTEKKFEDAAHSTAVAELLLPEEAGFLEAEGMEETFKFDQNQLKVRGEGVGDSMLPLGLAASGRERRCIWPPLSLGDERSGYSFAVCAEET